MSKPQRPRPGLMARIWPPVAPALLVILVAFLASMAPAGLKRTVTAALASLIVVIGHHVFIGNSGVISFGHISFMAIGAYVSALLTISPLIKGTQLTGLPEWLAVAQLNIVVAAVIAAAVATAVALIVGVPLMRLSGLGAAIATFSLLLIVYTVINNWRAVTAGPSVLVGVPIRTTLWSALSWALLALAVAYLFKSSKYGLRLQASREDEVAARSVSISVFRERLMAFAISAALVAIGGSLYGHLQGAFDANAFYLTATFLAIVMLVVGGAGSVAGTVVGTFLVAGASEILRRAEQGFSIAAVTIPPMPNLREVGLGLLLLAVLIWRPKGLLGTREIVWPFGPAVRPAGPREHTSPKPRAEELS